MWVAPQTNYRLTSKPVLYNNIGAESLPGSRIPPENIATIAGKKQIQPGSFLCNGDRILPRAVILSPYKGDGKVVVNNPSAFKPGDALKIIAASANASAFQELEAVERGTAPNFGTVVSVDDGATKQTSVLTPTGVAPGNTYGLFFDGIPIVYKAESSNVADVTKGIRDLVLSTRSGSSSLDFVNVTDKGTSLEFTGQVEGDFFAIAPFATGTGATFTVEVSQAVGLITVSGASQALPIGAKIGTIEHIPLGVIETDHILTTGDGFNHDVVICAYSAGMVYRDSLPYLDGQIVHRLPKLTFMPAYGV